MAHLKLNEFSCLYLELMAEHHHCMDNFCHYKAYPLKLPFIFKAHPGSQW